MCGRMRGLWLGIMTINLRKISAVWGIFFMVSMMSGCAADVSETDNGSQNNPSVVSEKGVEKEAVPDVNKIKNICELAALRCYYHNVAKSVKESGSGLFHLGEKDRAFWIEYTGIVEISFQAELIEVESEGSEIRITLPQPRVTCMVEQGSWNADSYVLSEDQWLQKNPITAADQTKAIEEAQKEMKRKVENNSSLLNTAKQQARDLIENYIRQIGSVTGRKYHIVWEVSETAQ